MINKPLISLCMIVKNEEKNIARALESGQTFVDEIIVVDTGSTDHTAEIARNYGAKIYPFIWQNDFSIARNYSLEKAVGQWVLILDADEEVEINTRSRIRSFIENTDVDGVMVTVRNINAPMALLDYYDSIQVRLFRNYLGFRYEQSVHNQISSSILRSGGKMIEKKSLIFLHYGYLGQTVQGEDNRLYRSMKMLEESVNRQPDNIYLNAKLAIIYFHLGDHALAYTYCYRVLTELDSQTLSLDLLKDILRVLSMVSIDRQYFDVAVRAARACLDLGANDVDVYVNAHDLLGKAYGGWGEKYLYQAVMLEKDSHWKMQQELWHQLLIKSHSALTYSREAYEFLLTQPHIREVHKPKIQTLITHCDELLEYITKRQSKHPLYPPQECNK